MLVKWSQATMHIDHGLAFIEAFKGGEEVMPLQGTFASCRYVSVTRGDK